MYIYTLQDPDGEIRYIGQTTRSLKQRLANHLAPNALLKTNKRTCWIRSILICGQKPTIKILQAASSMSELNAMEVYWIKFFQGQGCRLTNDAAGGEGCVGRVPWNKGKPQTQEVKDKIRISLTGHKHDLEARQNMGDSHRGKHYHTPESIEKIKKNQIGRPKSESTKRNMSKAASRRAQTPEGFASLMNRLKPKPNLYC